RVRVLHDRLGGLAIRRLRNRGPAFWIDQSDPDRTTGGRVVGKGAVRGLGPRARGVASATAGSGERDRGNQCEQAEPADSSLDGRRILTHIGHGGVLLSWAAVTELDRSLGDVHHKPETS